MEFCGLGMFWGGLWVLSSMGQYRKVLVIWFLMRFEVMKKVKSEFNVILHMFGVGFGWNYVVLGCFNGLP